MSDASPYPDGSLLEDGVKWRFASSKYIQRIPTARITMASTRPQPRSLLYMNRRAAGYACRSIAPLEEDSISESETKLGIEVSDG